MVLVVHSLHDLYVESGDFKYVKDAICLLEYAYGFSSSNHHFKLLLVKLYNTLGEVIVQTTRSVSEQNTVNRANK